MNTDNYDYDEMCANCKQTRGDHYSARCGNGTDGLFGTKFKPFTPTIHKHANGMTDGKLQMLMSGKKNKKTVDEFKNMC